MAGGSRPIGLAFLPACPPSRSAPRPPPRTFRRNFLPLLLKEEREEEIEGASKFGRRSHKSKKLPYIPSQQRGGGADSQL